MLKFNGKSSETIETILQIFYIRHLLDFLFAVKEFLDLSRKMSFEDLHSLCLSALFEVNGTMPWCLYALGETVKLFNKLVRRRDGTMNRKLVNILETRVPALATPVKGVSSKDVVINKLTNVWARIFTPTEDPAANNKLPVLVYYHGGGFGLLSADLSHYDKLCRVYCTAFNVVVVSVNYRLAPEHRFPTAYDDCFEALKWLDSPDAANQLPGMVDLSQCFLAGDSAGGNIVHFMACRAAAVREDFRSIKIRAAILLQPYFGSEERTMAELTLVNAAMISTEATDWHWNAFLPKGSNRDHPACNVFGPNSPDISNVSLSLPPLFVGIGSLDPLKDHQSRYVQGILKSGHRVNMKHYPGGIHGFFLFNADYNVGTKLARSCVQDMKEFIETHSSRKCYI